MYAYIYIVTHIHTYKHIYIDKPKNANINASHTSNNHRNDTTNINGRSIHDSYSNNDSDHDSKTWYYS